MDKLNNKLLNLKDKLEKDKPIIIMIIGLGSVGSYLLDYLMSVKDFKFNILIVGRNKAKMQMDVNVIKTASTIRRNCNSRIKIIDNCDLDNVESITSILFEENPDFIINSSRVYSGLKYGSISWNNLRAYGIWTPLSIRYPKNIMDAYDKSSCKAITINTSYSDAVIPWLKSAGKSYFDFGSGNINHLVPRIKFYVADKIGISNLNDIDITLALSHFHDVVISKEGHSEFQDILLDIKYNEKSLIINKEDLLKSCAIPMPVDYKRNMMNASSNFDIIYSILLAISSKKKMKIHSPGVDGEIGGYPVIIDGEICKAYFDLSVWSMSDMRNANKKSIYLDGIEDISDSKLVYTDELIEKVAKKFNVALPKYIKFEDIDKTADFLIKKIIEPFSSINS